MEAIDHFQFEKMMKQIIEINSHLSQLNENLVMIKDELHLLWAQKAGNDLK